MKIVQVTKFFMQFGLQNSHRFENIELDIPRCDGTHPVDLEVLTCAVQTFKTYFHSVQCIRVVFDLPRDSLESPFELDTKSIGRVIRLLKCLEDMVAIEPGRMQVVGLETHAVLQKAWNKSRKQWGSYCREMKNGPYKPYGCLL